MAVWVQVPLAVQTTDIDNSMSFLFFFVLFLVGLNVYRSLYGGTSTSSPIKMGTPSKVRSRPADHMQASAGLRLFNNHGVKLRKCQKNAQKLAYVQFLLYLCAQIAIINHKSYDPRQIRKR